MRYELKRVPLWPLIKVAFFLNLIGGFIGGLLYAPFFLLWMKVAGSTYGGQFDMSTFPTGMVVVVLPFAFSFGAAVFNTLAILIACGLYNVLRRLIGGIELEIEPTEVPGSEPPRGSLAANTRPLASVEERLQGPPPPPSVIPSPIAPVSGPPDLHPSRTETVLPEDTSEPSTFVPLNRLERMPRIDPEAQPPVAGRTDSEPGESTPRDPRPPDPPDTDPEPPGRSDPENEPPPPPPRDPWPPAGPQRGPEEDIPRSPRREPGPPPDRDFPS